MIGKGGEIPWHYPEELAHFREKTRGHVVVMGRKTFETVPMLFFQERTPVVFSRHALDIPVCTVVSSIEGFLAHQEEWQDRKIFVVGGADIAHLFLKHNLLTDFILTKIHKSYEGTAYLKLEYLDAWEETILVTTGNYTIVHLKNPHAG